MIQIYLCRSQRYLAFAIHLLYNGFMRYDGQLNIRMDKREIEKIKSRAARKDMSVGEYIRYMIDLGEKNDYGKDKPKSTDQPSNVISW